MALGIKRLEQKTDQPVIKLNCAANGCRLRGTISSGSGFVCQYHFSTNKWPQMTDVLSEQEHIMLALKQIQKYDDISWSKSMPVEKVYQPSGFEFLTRFMSGTDLEPKESEKNHYRWYERRLMDTLLYMAGVMKNPPVVREALKPTGRRGNLARFV